MEYLKEKLREKGMTQTELANRCKLSRRTINTICNKKFKKYPDVEIIYNICLTLDLDIKEFIEEIIK